MNRDSEALLLDFCARQKGAFQEIDWLESRIVDRQEMAVVCRFLAGADWYGHKQTLLNIAERLVAGSTENFVEMLKQVRFDCLRFSSMLKRRLRHARTSP